MMGVYLHVCAMNVARSQSLVNVFGLRVPLIDFAIHFNATVCKKFRAMPELC